MANDLAPTQVANGGGGTVDVGNVRAPDYRQVQSPVEVRTDLPNNEAAVRAAALGSLFKEFEGVSADEYNQVQTKRGALAGAASGATGHPQYREGLKQFTTFGRAFNIAATGAYAVEAEAQADDTAARLRVQANNNPDTFRTTYSAVRDSVLKNAPAEAVPMLTELYNKRLAAGLAAISGDQAQQQQQLHRQTYDEGVARLTSRVAILQGSQNPQDQLEAMDEHTKLSALIDGGVNSGLYSVAEAKAMNINAMRTITAQVFQTQVDRELSKPDGDVITLLDNFRKAHEDNLSDPTQTPILSEPEYQKLMADATTKIREQNLLVSMNRRDGKTAEQLKFEAGDQMYTSQLFQGVLTDRKLDVAVRNGDLKPETARSLHNMLNSGMGPTKSDPAAYARAIHDPNFLDMDGQDIANLPGISTADKLGLLKEQERRNASWENTQSVKQAKGSISAALKILPGTPTAALSDDQRRGLTDATQEFLQIMNDTDPAKRDGYAATAAQTAIKHVRIKDLQEQINSLAIRRQSAMANHGPGTSDQWDDAKMQKYLKQQDDAAAALRNQLKDLQ